jgi:basic membrane lipoprotein Med (substrate-binding protein (PBP1-ABC) superfamily)
MKIIAASILFAGLALLGCAVSAEKTDTTVEEGFAMCKADDPRGDDPYFRHRKHGAQPTPTDAGVDAKLPHPRLPDCHLRINGC